MDNDTFVVNGVTYQAFNEGEFNGATSWMVRKFNAGISPTSAYTNADYVECLLSFKTKDPLSAINEAIVKGSWG